MQDETELREALTARLSAIRGAACEIVALHPVTMGASKQIWQLTLAGGERLVLRAEPPEGGNAAGMAMEAEVLRAAHAAGVPVPEVIDSGDGTHGLGAAFVIMSHVDGETLPRRIVEDDHIARRRSSFTRELGAAIAGIHAIPRLGLASVREIDDVAAYRAATDTGPGSPAFELGWRWLEENRPRTRPRVLVHGDVRIGNVMVDDGHLVAILDWELCHVGDPLEDLGWVCTKAWRFGSPLAVGGIGEIDDLLDGYASVAGWRPTARELLWWSLFGSIRWGAMCRRQALRHLSGAEPSLELALIGRRVCENELDVLIALGHYEPGTTAAARADADDSPKQVFGEPSAAQLLEAASGELRESRAYRDRLLMSALGTVERELRTGPALAATLQDALGRAGHGSETELAAAIRAGAELTPAVLDAVRAGVIARLSVWNPRYLAHPASDDLRA